MQGVLTRLLVTKEQLERVHHSCTSLAKDKQRVEVRGSALAWRGASGVLLLDCLSLYSVDLRRTHTLCTAPASRSCLPRVTPPGRPSLRLPGAECSKCCCSSSTSEPSSGPPWRMEATAWGPRLSAIPGCRLLSRHQWLSQLCLQV
jgi:hypothetical protein